MALPPTTAMDRFSSAGGLAAARAEAAALASEEDSEESFGDGRTADVRQRGEPADRGAPDEPTSETDSSGAAHAMASFHHVAVFIDQTVDIACVFTIPYQ